MLTETAGDYPAPEPQSSQQLARRAAVASLVGTAVEWYDYFIFGTASILAFGKIFFPSEDPLTGTIAAFAVFGVGFFARPLGGIIFGHLGDRVGRKTALISTLMIMGLATFLMGLLPTTGQIGVWAPVMLVILRLLQGFGVGGEWGGASLVAVEYAPHGRRGAYGSFPQVGNAIGVALSTGIWAIVSQLPEDDLLAWGWRIPFLLSIVLVIVGALIRFRLTETPAFQAAQREAQRKKEESGEPEAKEGLPLIDVIRSYWRPLLIAMGMRLGEGVFGYIMLTFVLTYTQKSTTLARADVLLASTVAAVVAIFSFYWLGALSDRIGRRVVFMIGSGIGIVLAFPFFWILDTNSVPLMYALVIVAYSFGVGAMYSVEPSLFGELFGTKVRYTGVSLAAQIPSMLVGATPFFATWLLVIAGGATYLVSVFFLLMVGLAFFCAYIAPETRDIDLNADPYRKKRLPNSQTPTQQTPEGANL
jgi:MHS family shikimate/dehydroshikimate transporter-like MFS transporter